MSLGVRRVARPRVDDDDDALIGQRGGLSRRDANLRKATIQRNRQHARRARRRRGVLGRRRQRRRTRRTGTEIDGRGVPALAPRALNNRDNDARGDLPGGGPSRRRRGVRRAAFVLLIFLRRRRREFPGGQRRILVSRRGWNLGARRAPLRLGEESNRDDVTVYGALHRRSADDEDVRAAGVGSDASLPRRKPGRTHRALV